MGRYPLDHLPFRAGGDGHLPGVEFHVTPLDALRGQSTDGGQVLRQSYGGDDLRQLAGRLHSQNLQRHAGRGVHPAGPADDAHGQRQFQRAHQIAFRVLGPGRE